MLACYVTRYFCPNEDIDIDAVPLTEPVLVLTQAYLTLCNPMDCIPPGSSVHGVSQARILGWVAVYSSRGSSRPRDQIHISCTGRLIRYH